MTEDKYFLLEYFCPFREQRNPQEEDVQARGEKKKTAMCAKCRKKSGKEKLMYTPTQSPLSDAEPPMKQQVIATLLLFIIYLLNHKS